jgi:two-component system response regulator HydG
MNSNSNILIVDDEKAHRFMLRAHLEDAGYEVIEAQDGLEALDVLSSHPVDLALLDILMPRMDGMQALPHMLALSPVLPIIIMTAYSSLENAVNALKMGASDYLAKPLDIEELLLKIARSLKETQLSRQVANQAQRLGEMFNFSALAGQSLPMLRLKELLAQVSASQALVLITGESGTGKEIVAQILHQNSSRKDLPLVKINCAALPEQLLESELFGYEKGAFTGALQRHPGRFQAAGDGTIFLDEVGEMPLSTQVKLLRFLQEGEFSPLGATRTCYSKARVIAATNRNLEEAVSDGTFREDLYYRLNVVNIHLPPLRERGEDKLLLAERFLQDSCANNQRRLSGFSKNAQQRILAYHWPGNVRELSNAVERAVVLCKGPLVEEHDLPSGVLASLIQPESGAHNIKPGMTLQEMERHLIIATLESTNQNRTQAALMLGITRKTLHNKIKEYGLAQDNVYRFPYPFR